MELSLKPPKSLFVMPSRWRSIVLGPLGFALLAFAVLSTNFVQRLVHNPLANATWIPKSTLNSSIPEQFYMLIFHRGASPALRRNFSALVPSPPAADAVFFEPNAPGQPYSNQYPPAGENNGTNSDAIIISEQSENRSRNTNVSPTTSESLHKINSSQELEHRAPATNDTLGSLPGDAPLNSSAPTEPVRWNATHGNSSLVGERPLNPTSNNVDRTGRQRERGNSQHPRSRLKPPIGHCDFSVGKWVEDTSPSLYQPGACEFIDQGFSCQQNGRPDATYMRWKWVPRDCNVPRLNGTRLLEELRGKRFLFVGDSLNRNQWESMVCILRQSLADKTRASEIHGDHEFKTPGVYIFKFQDYNCTLEFYTTHFLVDQDEDESRGNFTVWLDRMDKTERDWRRADVLVFNTGHWWTEDKIKEGDMFREGALIHHKLDVTAAYRKAMQTWANWVDKYINATSTRVFFRGYSPVHYSGGQWNSGGQCQSEIIPIFNESFISPYPSNMQVVEEVISHMRVPVQILNITRLSDFRKDAHPATYGYRPQEIKDYQDCSHWCLPGVPDTWNELLSFALLGDED